MQGIVVIAFGKEYDKMAAYTVGYSKKFTKYPFCILTNVKERHPNWGDCKGVEFKYFDLKDDQNREVKTTLIDHTPFDTTLYMDCDALIQTQNADAVFNLKSDMVFNEYCSWGVGQKIPRLYAELFKKHNILRRVSILSGGCFLFKKNNAVKEFFEFWDTIWIEEGKGRDMHCLAVAALKSGINYAISRKLFNPDMMGDNLVQHQCKGWHEKFGIPEIKGDKTCVKEHSTAYQWNMVEFQ